MPDDPFPEDGVIWHGEGRFILRIEVLPESSPFLIEYDPETDGFPVPIGGTHVAYIRPITLRQQVFLAWRRLWSRFSGFFTA